VLAGKPLKLHATATSQKEEEWQLANTGILTMKFLWLHAAHLHHVPPPVAPMSEIWRETILDVLCGLRPVDQNVFLKAVFAGNAVSEEQVLSLLSDTPLLASRVNLVCNVFHKLETQAAQDAVLESLTSEEMDAVQEKLGSTILFSKYNPTGMYRLDLADCVQREVALMIAQVLTRTFLYVFTPLSRHMLRFPRVPSRLHDHLFSILAFFSSAATVLPLSCPHRLHTVYSP